MRVCRPAIEMPYRIIFFSRATPPLERKHINKFMPCLLFRWYNMKTGVNCYMTLYPG